MYSITDNFNPTRSTINSDEYEPDYEGSTHISREIEAGCESPNNRPPNNTGFSREGVDDAFSQEVYERANIARS